jgi:hypothetical protein
MLQQFFAAMRVAWVAGQISARHTLGRPSALAYHHPLEQCMFSTLNSSKSGVFVHWGVYESGKSTAVRHAAWRLQAEAGRQVISFSGFEFSWYEPMKVRVRRAIGVPVDLDDKPLSDFFILKRLVGTSIIIDHFDSLMRDKDNSAMQTLELVRELIKESEVAENTFNVLLVVTSWERAQELVDAGCQLVLGDAPGRWTREQLEGLFATASEPIREKVGERREDHLRLSTLSGTPGFFTGAYGVRSSGARQAAMHDLEWRRGMKALYKQAHLDLSPHVEKGRYPDRNGIYHHEDLAGLIIGVCN